MDLVLSSRGAYIYFQNAQKNKDHAKLRDLFEEWIKGFSGHGLPNIYRAKFLITRLLWTACYLACFGYTLYLVTNSVHRYYSYETVVSTQIIRETPTDFPAVTICNLNPFNEIYSYDQMAKVAQVLPETRNCSVRKTYLMEQMRDVLINEFIQLNLTFNQQCSKRRKRQIEVHAKNGLNTHYEENQLTISLCLMYVFDSPTVYQEVEFVIFNLTWTRISGKWDLTVSQAFDLLGWPSTGFFQALASTIWSNMTIGDWFNTYGIDFDVLSNPADGLNDCLNIMSPDAINQVLDKIKRNFSNGHMRDYLPALDNRGFDLKLDMLQSCQFNQLPCYASYIMNYGCKYPDNCSSVTYGTDNSFSAFWNNQYGMCYTFNDGNITGPILQTSQSGPDYGLTMSLLVGWYLIFFSSFLTYILFEKLS
jgi:hypothetical protein